LPTENAPQFKEIIMNTHPFNSQNFCPNIGQPFFLSGARSHKGLITMPSIDVQKNNLKKANSE